jgi:uncharacterized membrane protein
MYCRCFFIIPIIIIIITLSWWYKPVQVQVNTCTISDLVDDPSAIDRAVQKMGPRYTYIVTVDGKLMVKIDNKWLRLHY